MSTTINARQRPKPSARISSNRSDASPLPLAPKPRDDGMTRRRPGSGASRTHLRVAPRRGRPARRRVRRRVGAAAAWSSPTQYGCAHPAHRVDAGPRGRRVCSSAAGYGVLPALICIVAMGWTNPAVRRPRRPRRRAQRRLTLPRRFAVRDLDAWRAGYEHRAAEDGAAPARRGARPGRTRRCRSLGRSCGPVSGQGSRWASGTFRCPWRMTLDDPGGQRRGSPSRPA